MLVLAALPCILTAQARAETVSVTIATDSVTVQMSLLLTENITALPLINAQIGPSNATTVLESFTQPIESAIQESVPGATVSSLYLSVRTSNNTGVWSLSENYALIVVGANKNSGGSIASNLGFLSMNVTSPFQVGGLELNFVGSTVLLPALEAKAAEYSNLKYYIDGSNPTTAFIPEQTTKQFSVLDFTWVAPVWTWTINHNILGQDTSWTLQPSNPQYNLTVGVPSPEGPLILTYDALYSPSMSITVPANAWADGNNVYFDIPSPAESLMPTIIVVSLIIAVATIILDRRLTRPLRARKKR
jgi:hypothetical protein